MTQYAKKYFKDYYFIDYLGSYLKCFRSMWWGKIDSTNTLAVDKGYYFNWDPNYNVHGC